MKTTSESLIADLIELTEKNIYDVEKLNQLPLNKLNFKTDEKSWSILECIEHLNLYGDFYLPKIEKLINSSKTTPDNLYKAGLLGDYFAKSMQPKVNLNKMNTFKSKNPIGSDLNKNALDRFLSQQEKTIILLNKSRNVSLGKIKIPTTLGKLVKLKLGDTFRVVIYHNQRHIIQAKKVIKT